MKRSLLALGTAAVMIMAAAPRTEAAPIALTFSSPIIGAGGTVTEGTSGGNSFFTGTDIVLTSVASGGTSFDLINGRLNFQTGNCVAGPSGTQNCSAGGNITITGGVDLPGPGDIAVGTTLLVGTFANASYSNFDPLNALGGTGSDTKNADLLAAFGINPLGFTFSQIETYFTVGGQVTSASLTNTAAVPEPGSMLLFGTGLFGLAGLARKRFGRFGVA